MFSYKVIRTPEVTLINICDEELLGREFREGDIVLRITQSFYGGEKTKNIEGLLREGDIISLVGERAISTAVALGYVKWNAVKRVDGIPFVNIYKL